jgi:CRP-like cAMP-binding protein
MTIIDSAPLARHLATDLTDLAFFGDCEPADVAAVAATGVGVRTVPAGTVLCREGEPSTNWWIVAEGKVDVSLRGQHVASIGVGESVGEMGVLDGIPRAATVAASSAVTVFEIEGRRMADTLRNRPRLALAALRQMARRLRSTNTMCTAESDLDARHLGRVDPPIKPAHLPMSVL